MSSFSKYDIASNVSEKLIDTVTNFQSIHQEQLSERSDIICFFQKCNKVAAASFNIFSLEVRILESCNNCRPNYPLIQIIFSNFKPKFIMYNLNSPQDFQEYLQKFTRLNKIEYTCLSSTLFNYANCKEAIFSTHYSHISDKINYINSVITTSDERLVCALGALLTHLKVTLPDLASNCSPELNINAILPMTFEDVVWIDKETLRCLQIFEALEHPSGFKWTNDSYQGGSPGLSLFTLLEKHCCLLGSSKLRHFLATPTNDMLVLKKRHEAIKFCIDSKNIHVIESMKLQMSHLSPVYILVRNIECSDVRGKHWKCIYQNIYYTIMLAETCKEFMGKVQLFHEIAESLTDEMYAMAYHLDRIIDFQSMEGNEEFFVKTGVCETLEKAKQDFFKLMQTINEIVPYEFDSLPTYIEKIHMLYIPEMKFLLSIPYWKKHLKKEDLEIDNLEYKVALLTYLAHIGSYLPARYAEIGMLNHIHTRLSLSESIISESSSFMNELRKLVSISNNSFPRSLLVLDELGKGSTELSGVAILASYLNHFVKLGSRSPHIIVSTHLTDVTKYVHSVNNLSVHVLNALRMGDVAPYTVMRLQKYRSYLYFLKRFTAIDANKNGVIEKLKTKLKSLTGL